MRTTVDIDDRLLARAKRVAAATGQTLGEVLSAALDVFLARPADDASPPFELIVHGKPGDRFPSAEEIASIEAEDAESASRFGR